MAADAGECEVLFTRQSGRILQLPLLFRTGARNSGPVIKAAACSMLPYRRRFELHQT